MLEGIRILDLSQYLPGPLCSQILADLGADVIKIEHPRLGDPIRHMGAPLPGTTVSGMFYQVNRNKRSVALSVKNPAGQEIIKKLLAECDVLLEGFRPGMLAELGLGYEDLKEKFPRLVYCSISGYGATGPFRDLAGHDGNYLAYSGLLSVTGTVETPVLPGFQLADLGGGTWPAVTGILAALIERGRTGRGRYLDISMLDGAFAFWAVLAGEALAQGTEPARQRMALNGGLPNYQVYRTRDDRFVMFGALEERFLRAFFRRLGQTERLTALEAALQSGQLEALRSELTAIFGSRTLAEWDPFFADDECCLAPVLTFSEACTNAQLKSRQMWQEPAENRPGMIGNPILAGQPVCRLPPPELGQHTEEVLAASGYSSEEIADLRRKRVIG